MKFGCHHSNQSRIAGVGGLVYILLPANRTVMASDIPESDWRHFKKVRSVLLERYCARVLADLQDAIGATEGTAHERYLRVFKLIDQRNDDMGRAFDDFRRSTAVMQLGIMRRMELLTDEELSVFSPETQARVRGIASL